MWGDFLCQFLRLACLISTVRISVGGFFRSMTPIGALNDKITICIMEIIDLTYCVSNLH